MDNPKDVQDWGPLRSFGRIKARALKPRQASLVDTLLPQIEVTPERIAAALSAGKEIVFEIGFGAGEHIANQARANPDKIFIGCEPFLNGVGSLLRHIDEMGLKNILILNGDARPLMESLPEGSIALTYILFPDPWPKARHQKRRLIQKDTLAVLAHILKDGGRLRFATDWAEYADWTLALILGTTTFNWPAQGKKEWTSAPIDHFQTRYETKGLGDCPPVFLDFYRNAR